MKLKAVTTFKDKYDANVIYEAGKEYDFEEKRAEELLKTSYVEKVGKSEKEPEAPKAKGEEKDKADKKETKKK